MINKLKFWSNKILPLVYDESLSYYEVLCKVRDAINALVDANTALQTEWNNYQQQTEQELMDFITGYLTDDKIAEIIKTVKLFYVDCSDYCKGDGTTDDTENLKSAIAVCKQTKKPLYVGDGKYVITSTVALGDDLTIIGYNITPGEDNASPIIINNCNENTPLFTFGRSVTVKNIAIDEPKNITSNTHPYNYGYVFYSDYSNDCLFENVLFNRCTNGIKTVHGGRNIYTNMKMGCFVNDFWIENRMDSDEYNNLHLWPFGFGVDDELFKYQGQNCKHIILINSDDMVFNNILSYGGKTLFELDNGGNGRGPWMTATGIKADVISGNILNVIKGFSVHLNDIYVSSEARPNNTPYFNVNDCEYCSLTNVTCVSNPFVPIVTGNANVDLFNVKYGELDFLNGYTGSLNGPIQSGSCINPILQINGVKWELGETKFNTTVSLTPTAPSNGMRLNTQDGLSCHPQIVKIVAPSTVDIYVRAGEYENETLCARFLGGNTYYIPIMGAYPLFANFGTYFAFYGNGNENIEITVYDCYMVNGAAFDYVAKYWKENNGEISLIGQNCRYKCTTQPPAERCKNGDIYISLTGEQKMLVNGAWT